jgi:hypothetical protein
MVSTTFGPGCSFLMCQIIRIYCLSHDRLKDFYYVCLSLHKWQQMGMLLKKKVKCTLVQALRLCTGCMAHRGSRGIALPIHDHGTRRGWGSASRPGHFLPPGKTLYPLYRRLGGPQGRSGHVQKILPPPGFDPWTVQPVAICYTDCATWPKMLWKTTV